MSVEISFRSDRLKTGTIVRPMSSAGTYWREGYSHPQAAYVVTQDLIFSVCHFDWSGRDIEYYTEHDDITPEEVRLFASLGLPIGWDRGFMLLYPHYLSFIFPEQPPLDDPITISRIEAALRDAIAANGRAVGLDPPLPPNQYNHFHWPLPEAVHRNLYCRIDDHDDVLIRGLATWLKASMLVGHRSFAEEANYPLWISLDASFSLICEILREQGNGNPSAIDAQNFIHDAFDEPQSGNRYFEEFYEDRIMSMHPQNRFGTFGFAPIKHCDFYYLHNGLREVYRLILLGENVDPQASFDTEDFWAQFKLTHPG